jgi:hypothetical protein
MSNEQLFAKAYEQKEIEVSWKLRRGGLNVF